VIPRLKKQYNEAIAPALREKFNYANPMMTPRLEKIVVNMGVGDGNTEPRLLEAAIEELALITGQRPSPRIARKSISNFKLREGQKIGAMVTLRGDRMYEFLDRLLSVAVPRIRDFRGMPDKSFDKSFNYTIGIREQTIFPEIDSDKVIKVRGMNITFVINNSQSRDESYELLEQFGMPFVRRN
jgi:large subunit ribosomal protein L5